MVTILVIVPVIKMVTIWIVMPVIKMARILLGELISIRNTSIVKSVIQEFEEELLNA